MILSSYGYEIWRHKQQVVMWKCRFFTFFCGVTMGGFQGFRNPTPPPSWAMKLALFQAKVSFSSRRSVRGLQGNICCSAWSFRFEIPINSTRSYGCQCERLFANQFEIIIWNLNSDSNGTSHSPFHNITMYSQKSSHSQAMIYATHCWSAAAARRHTEKLKD